MYGEDYKCSGFREKMKDDLYKLFNDNRESFQIAWRNGDYMCSHAGILSDWVWKYNDRLSYYAGKFEIDRLTGVDILLNAISETHDRWMLATVPTVRGGVPGSVGGPLWADESEIKSKKNSCLHKYTHIVGHNHVEQITEYIHKGGPTTIFTDCLGINEQFLVLKK